MAAASGPVETSSGKTMEVEARLPEATESESQPNADSNSNPGGFKMPILGTDKKKPDPEPEKSEDQPSVAPISLPQIKKTPVLSPAEQLKQRQCIPYKEPSWSGVPSESDKFSFDVLKNGTLIGNIELGKEPWIVFGRLPSCDVCMEHPSLSRHHAVVQYRDTSEDGHERGWYLYDLDSTHGTWVNKLKVKPKVYRRLRVGHVIKFGGSSRLFVLQGPEDDREPESEMSVSELKEQTAKLKKEAEVLKQAEIEQEEERERERQNILDARGCLWGMSEDAEEEAEKNPFALGVPEHEHLYKDDPKKALKGFYEREGCDLPDYQFTEVGFGKHKCIVELPVDGVNGEPLVAEVTVSGKRKDAVIACALEACHLLDVHGLLHASKHEGRHKKSKNWEDDDFYDSDEDTFLDRTGTIEKKRICRMQKAGKDLKAETYDSLLPKHQEVQKRIAEIEEKLDQAKKQTEAAAAEEEDALEAYMTAIKAGVMDTKTRLSLKRELLTLRTEEQRLCKMVNLAKPAEMPELKKLYSGMKKSLASSTSLPVAAVRKIASVKGPKRPLPLPMEPMQTDNSNFKEEEEEDDEEEESSEAQQTSPEQPSSTKIYHSISKQATEKHCEDSAKVLESMDTEPSNIENIKSVTSSVPVSKNTEMIAARKIKAAEGETKKLKLKADVRSSLKGPTLPLPLTASSAETRVEPTVSKSSSVDFEGRTFPPAKKKRTCRPKKPDYDASDPDYATWLPPTNQSGDGRTSLNDKLGY